MDTTQILNKYGFEEFHSNPRLDSFFVYKKSYYPFIIRRDRNSDLWYGDIFINSEERLCIIFYAMNNENLSSK